MKKQQIAQAAIHIEWKHKIVGDGTTDMDCCEADMRAIAQALGRLAARRDMASARAARAQCNPNSTAIVPTRSRKVLN